jgi:ribosome-associated toxin RatA of RatAB toxin-antitoxin module
VIRLDRITVAAPRGLVYSVASDVERWPEFLSHYRWVRILERAADAAIVEMAAWRPFGWFKYPTWWVSEMRLEPERAIRYRHIRGITRGMDVEWSLEETGNGVEVRIVHRWGGPAWPLIGGAAADLVIGPVFVHGIASRTLAGVKRRAESWFAEQ